MEPGGLEAKYIRESHSALMGHIADRKYSLRIRIAATAIGLFGAALGVSVVLSIGGDAFDMMHGAVVSGETIPVHRRYWMSAGMLSLLAVFGVTWKASLVVAAPFWPALAEYDGRNSIQFSPDEDDTAEKLAARGRYRIEAALRRGTIAAGRRFDPADFLRQESIRVRWMWFALAIVVMLISVWLFQRAAQP